MRATTTSVSRASLAICLVELDEVAATVPSSLTSMGATCLIRAMKIKMKTNQKEVKSAMAFAGKGRILRGKLEIKKKSGWFEHEVQNQ